MIAVLTEPSLEFGNAYQHVDIRGGLTAYGPYDLEDPNRPTRIGIGVVASREDCGMFVNWLEETARGIPAKESRQPNLFPAFPGLGDDATFRCQFSVDERAEMSRQDIAALCSIATHSEFCQKVAQELVQEAVRLSDKKPQVIIIILPNEILTRSAELAAGRAGKAVQGLVSDLHDILKAKALTARIQTQVLWPSTIGGKPITRQNLRNLRKHVVRQQQDEATRAWNLLTALYYKAKGSPWRLPKNPKKLTSCFIGLGFYKNAEDTALQTSMAQVFDELGDGLILQGGPAAFSKNDRRPYLPADQAKQLILQLLDAYRKEHKTHPARCVFHRRSGFREEEMEGIHEALKERGVDYHDLVSFRPSDIRICRSGAYPVPRGTCMKLDDEIALLYPRGSVEYFSTYPGSYVPRSLEVRRDFGDTDILQLCSEVLSLTKMNWNNTQFDGNSPITLRAASKVGDVLRWLPAYSPIPHRYSFFM